METLETKQLIQAITLHIYIFTSVPYFYQVNNILKLITMPLAFTFIKEVNREHILDIIAEL